MRRDLKIGMLSGVVLAGITFIYICTRPGLSTRARMLKANQKACQERTYVQSQPGQARMDSIQPEPEPLLAAEPQEEETQVYEMPEKIKTSRFYIVRKGDTLSAISRRYYGSPNKWHRIHEANYDVLSGNPNKLAPGMKLTIPD